MAQRGSVPRDHHLTRHLSEKLQQFLVVGFLVVEPIPPLRAASALQIRRVAVDELRAFERELAEEPVGTAVNGLDRVHALERIERASVAVDADVAQRRGLALHNRTPTEMGLDVGGVRRHHRNQGLAQPRGRLRPEIAYSRRSHRRYGSRTIATRRYDVNAAETLPFRAFRVRADRGAIDESSIRLPDAT